MTRRLRLSSHKAFLRPSAGAQPATGTPELAPARIVNTQAARWIVSNAAKVGAVLPTMSSPSTVSFRPHGPTSLSTSAVGRAAEHADERRRVILMIFEKDRPEFGMATQALELILRSGRPPPSVGSQFQIQPSSQ
jgi:hypothetical protein